MLLFQSLFVYIGLIILMTITSLWATQKHYKIRMIVPVLIFSITFGLRYGVGIDYYTYLQSYYDSPEIVQDYYEPGYVFLLDICKYISIGPELFFTLLAFLQIFFIYYAFNYLPRKAVVFLPVYLIFTGLAMAGFMNNIRQTIALALFIFSIHYIVEKRVLPFYIFCFLILCVFLGVQNLYAIIYETAYLKNNTTVRMPLSWIYCLVDGTALFRESPKMARRLVK